MCVKIYIYIHIYINLEFNRFEFRLLKFVPGKLQQTSEFGEAFAVRNSLQPNMSKDPKPVSRGKSGTS